MDGCHLRQLVTGEGGGKGGGVVNNCGCEAWKWKEGNGEGGKKLEGSNGKGKKGKVNGYNR